ncbi:hypothetical protein E4N62_17080 [Streptomyces sp. MNU76]|nr:hypothetical protein [Streptomyces sp. MNU76]MCC9706833.1 hypothetical protein [Streptomyces sp. MNU76]
MSVPAPGVGDSLGAGALLDRFRGAAAPAADSGAREAEATGDYGDKR